jgi:ribonuclease III
MNESPSPSDLAAIEARLGYHFRDRGLLEQALTHSSFAHEQEQKATDKVTDKNVGPTSLVQSHYERLEFLGDAVLDLAIGHLLMQQFAEAEEGDLTQYRARLVNESGLAELALELDLDQMLLLGKGEDSTGGRKKPSILASGYEAVVAAVYLDGGYEAAFNLIQHHFQARLARLSEAETIQDSKTRFQELVQAKHKLAPSYRVIQERGPDHNKEFLVVLLVAGRELARAWGKSKKEAERKAAEEAIQKLFEE